MRLLPSSRTSMPRVTRSEGVPMTLSASWWEQQQQMQAVQCQSSVHQSSTLPDTDLHRTCSTSTQPCAPSSLFDS